MADPHRSRSNVLGRRPAAAAQPPPARARVRVFITPWPDRESSNSGAQQQLMRAPTLPK